MDNSGLLVSFSLSLSLCVCVCVCVYVVNRRLVVRRAVSGRRVGRQLAQVCRLRTPAEVRRRRQVQSTQARLAVYAVAACLSVCLSQACQKNSSTVELVDFT